MFAKIIAKIRRVARVMSSAAVQVARPVMSAVPANTEKIHNFPRALLTAVSRQLRLLAPVFGGVLLCFSAAAETGNRDISFSLGNNEFIAANQGGFAANSDESEESEESGDESESGRSDDSDGFRGFLRDVREGDNKTGFSIDMATGVVIGDSNYCDDLKAQHDSNGENGYSLTCGWGGFALKLGARYNLNRYFAATAGYLYSFDSYSVEPDYGATGSNFQDFASIPVGASFTVPFDDDGDFGLTFDFGYHWWERTGTGTLTFTRTGNSYIFNDAEGEDIYYGVGFKFPFGYFKWTRMNGDDPDHVGDPTVDSFEGGYEFTF